MGLLYFINFCEEAMIVLFQTIFSRMFVEKTTLDNIVSAPEEEEVFFAA